MSARTFSSRRARVSAALTGRGREIGPELAHERNVLAITRRIHTKATRLRALAVQIKRLRRELRHDRRELRAVLQRDSSITTEEQLEVAGKADGVDRTIALTEERER